jgi:hypothetical protein
VICQVTLSFNYPGNSQETYNIRPIYARKNNTTNTSGEMVNEYRNQVETARLMAINICTDSKNNRPDKPWKNPKYIFFAAA